jgi:hypothetical protein
MSRSDCVRWHCPNRDCNCWFVSIEEAGEAAPQCIYGRTMQREEAVVSGFLDFLRERTAEQAQ